MGVQKLRVFESMNPERHFPRPPDPKSGAIYLVPFGAGWTWSQIFSWGWKEVDWGWGCLIEGSVERGKLEGHGEFRPQGIKMLM